MPCGAYRCVFLLGRFVIKVPRLLNLHSGMRCNRWEQEMYSRWLPRFGWRSLCPVVRCGPWGAYLVMRRAVMPEVPIEPVAWERELEAEHEQNLPVIAAHQSRHSRQAASGH